MIEIHGKYASAKVFTDELEPSAQGQIQAMCDQPFTKGAKIRIMPDVHAGAGCTIGTTMTIGEYVVPNIVGVDIGCGMNVVRLSEKRLDLPKLDSFIRANIPHGRDVRDRPHRSHGRLDFEELRCLKKLDRRRIKESLGTLGGGNHFIEIDRDDDMNLYLVIHTGIRNPGLQVAQYYQNEAYRALGGKKGTDVPYELSYLSGELMEDYLNDMDFMQRFAAQNRLIIQEEILDRMKLSPADFFTTVHNYIDIKKMILRKGAVSAAAGERLIIPLNMRDGALICTGLGNTDWNESAPHGAGRLYSRREAEERFTVSQFKKEMAGIFTTSADRDTLDECPMAYKDAESIIGAVGDTVTIEKRIKPIYNFKSSDRFGKK
ncbi:MAG: RtcB family protein [Clostridia bacterium]|nr:RtcB family protein [Clostridia bacterium]